MVMPVMKGGGAERVASLLINEFHSRGIHTEFLLTSCKPEDVIRTDLKDEIPLLFLSDKLPEKSMFFSIRMNILKIYSSFFSKIFEKLNKSVPAHFAYFSFVCQYQQEINALREILKQNPDLIVITFLQPTIPMVLLAAKGLPNRIIISERGNPNRLIKSRYGYNFIKKYYKRVQKAVFQTGDAKAVYPDNVSGKGTVISNPIKAGLPQPYHGDRNKNITTFCRISKQKNLPVLIDAFSKLHLEHPDYILRIIGDASNKEGEEVLAYITKQIGDLKLSDNVKIEPFMKNVHENIIKDAMYVSSSDYEGISNSMLEAMAIGMPVVCTDCPIGGAKATIKDGENGLLVPIKDADALYMGMKKVIEDKTLADKLSHNAAKLRDELSLDKITDRWIELLGEN